MKRRYDPEDPARLPEEADPADPELAAREWFLEISVHGPFWQLREWLGFENLCTMFLDDPGFVREMIGFWEDYILRLLRRAFRYAIPDCVHISEDMAYKSFSMISPGMVREFLLPTWRRWGEALSRAGVPIYAVDSDGFVGELIPIWIEGGLHCCDPVEVAAGNDLNAFRRTFGQRMAYRGGVDKRAMARGGKALDDEIARLAPAIRGGGYIPSCDHGIPSDVSWQNYLHYVRRLAELCGWL
jgi:uroporphyrinogen decarboxylase